MARSRRFVRWILWALMGIAAVSLVLAAIVVIPIVTHTDAGPATPAPTASDPSTASSTGPDGRTRTLSVFEEDGVTPADLSAVKAGDRFVVKGSGFDSSYGVYVAVCEDPGDPLVKPSPCIGGIPEDATDGKDPDAPDTHEFLETTWISDNWAWRAFATRGYDNSEAGEFTAYLTIPASSTDLIDCTTTECAIVSRNDHTAANDRVQDLLVPIRFAS
ncbi:hypothetical protein [Lysinibacter cavernae]|uniref:Uncharacterized protein n=1 Tax=Lysinibacter cavernae TaxID=1640652 RepID=A0A7X5R1W0_9MICO|nr:hypothetical protein [Lysinibacter cavernae]NIH53897.1 hypothetical protein [Lysinibacter cavernae]